MNLLVFANSHFASCTLLGTLQGGGGGEEGQRVRKRGGGRGGGGGKNCDGRNKFIEVAAQRPTRAARRDEFVSPPWEFPPPPPLLPSPLFTLINSNFYLNSALCEGFAALSTLISTYSYPYTRFLNHICTQAQLIAQIL